MNFSTLVTIGFFGSILMMFRFAKFCRLLNSRWNLDQETAERYQAGAQRSLAAAGVLLAGCVVFFILGLIFS